MTITLIHAAIGLLICACVLIAPHAGTRAGTLGSLAFSSMAAVCVATLAYLELIA